MSLSTTSGAVQPDPTNRNSVPSAVAPSDGPTGVPAHASTVPAAVVPPTIASKAFAAAFAAEPQQASGHSPCRTPAPARLLHGSEPHVVDLAHPMDHPDTRADPLSKYIARLASDAQGSLDIRIDSGQMLDALVNCLRAGLPVHTLRLQADFRQLPANVWRKCGDAPSLRSLLDVAGELKVLDLGACKFEQKDYPWLARFLSSDRCKLQVLCLSACAIHDEAAKALAHAIRANNSLTTLTLRAATLMPTGWTYVTTALSAGWPCIGAPMGGRRFEVLVLESTRAGEVPFHLLRTILRDNSQLRELVVSCCAKRTEDPTMPEEDWTEEFDHFCEVLKQSDSLFVLDLSCYRFPASIVDKLILALDANQHIEVFQLGDNSLTREQSDRIAAIGARNALANHARHDMHAAAALDLLVPASAGFAAGSIWPRELSDEIAGRMDWRTLLMIRQGLEAGFPAPAGTPASVDVHSGAPASTAQDSLASGDATGTPPGNASLRG